MTSHNSEILRVPSYVGPFRTDDGRLVRTVSPRSRFSPDPTISSLCSADCR